jgi:hypothetical protein
LTACIRILTRSITAAPGWDWDYSSAAKLSAFTKAASGFSASPGGAAPLPSLPIYSLAKLLAPVVIYQERLRPAFVLVRVDLLPLITPPRGNWKDTWRQCLEILRHCVYLDKDLVSPPMGTSNHRNGFLWWPRWTCRMPGLRKQLERVSELNTKCTVTVTAVPVELPTASADATLEQQVQTVAASVTQTILASVDRKLLSAAKSARNVN